MPNLKAFGDTLLLDVDRIIAIQYFPTFRMSVATRIDITLQTAYGVVKITTEEPEAIDDLCEYIEDSRKPQAPLAQDRVQKC